MVINKINKVCSVTYKSNNSKNLKKQINKGNLNFSQEIRQNNFSQKLQRYAKKLSDFMIKFLDTL